MAAKPGSSGICRVPWIWSWSPRTASGIASFPLTHTVSRTAAAPPGHEACRRRPARASRTGSAPGPRGASPGASRSRGARRRSSECSARTAPRPAQPTPQSSTPAISSAMAGPGPRRRSVARGGDRRYGGNRIVVGEPGVRSGSSRRRPGAAAAGAGEGDAPEQEPRPPRPGRDRGGPEVPQEQPGPERGGRHRCAPALHRARHTVTWERRSSMVAGPIPDTSSS